MSFPWTTLSTRCEANFQRSCVYVCEPHLWPVADKWPNMVGTPWQIKYLTRNPNRWSLAFCSWCGRFAGRRKNRTVSKDVWSWLCIRILCWLREIVQFLIDFLIIFDIKISYASIDFSFVHSWKLSGCLILFPRKYWTEETEGKNSRDFFFKDRQKLMMKWWFLQIFRSSETDEFSENNVNRNYEESFSRRIFFNLRNGLTSKHKDNLKEAKLYEISRSIISQ